LQKIVTGRCVNVQLSYLSNTRIQDHFILAYHPLLIMANVTSHLKKCVASFDQQFSWLTYQVCIIFTNENQEVEDKSCDWFDDTDWKASLCYVCSCLIWILCSVIQKTPTLNRLSIVSLNTIYFISIEPPTLLG